MYWFAELALAWSSSFKKLYFFVFVKEVTTWLEYMLHEYNHDIFLKKKKKKQERKKKQEKLKTATTQKKFF